MRSRPYFLLILLVVLVDQITKVVIKLNMYLGQEINLMGNWMKVYFAENNGFAFGMTFSDLLYDMGVYLTPESGKFLLTLLSLIAVVGLSLGYAQICGHISLTFPYLSPLSWEELLVTSSIAFFMGWFSPPLIPIKVEFSRDRWLICFFSALEKAANIHPYSILRMFQLHWELS